ncbi:MAG: sigma-70 family RNA polymerase sigma factor, partial [Chloroflexota bacterium]|nr:sigma-70 family RNA polymerase sigma factor [Chloroflexota bacterium]
PRRRCIGCATVEGRPLTDSDLIERARRGDVAAYEELVRRYEMLAFRTAVLICRDADEARDAAQEGFVRAWHALPRFRAGAEPRPWILQIVANAARNRRRGSTRRESLALRLAQDRPSGGAAPSPEAAVLAGERRQELLAAVNGLRDEDREVLAFRWFLDLGEAEMAAALGIPRGTVKSRLSRAMGRLRAALSADTGQVRIDG